MEKDKFIKAWDIPADVRKQYAKYTRLELYSDCLVGKGSKNGDITWYFKNYIAIQWTPANLGTQFANLVFTTPESSGKLINVSNLSQAVDINRIMFCSGMFSYARANNYVKELYIEIKKVFDEYKSNESKTAIASKDANISSADEIKKYKELLDIGAITQEEYDAKKKQILGL